MSSDMWDQLQQRGVQAVQQAILDGLRRIVLSSPTGSGKTRMACMMVEQWLEEGHKVSIYTRRKMLVDQLGAVLNKRGIDFGTRAAGHKPDDFMPVQICSFQTEEARVYKQQRWSLFPSSRVLVDEVHDCTGPVGAKIIDHYSMEGASVVGLSATPLSLGDIFDVLIQAGTNSELRACGALVPAIHYAPDEPDMKQHKALQAGKLPTEPEVKKIMRPNLLFGSVEKNLRLLNPELKPTILFAAGVAESLWFAEELTKAGIPSAHIDGDSVWVGGKLYRADQKAREAVMSGSSDGTIRAICNRFVLREGVDAPWLCHGVFATVFGSLQSYLQSGGRLLRSDGQLQSVTIQDHGGNWWRHGSLNADRHWKLEWTGDIERAIREDAQRAKQLPQPGLCPKCGMVLFRANCRCGWTSTVWKRSKQVMQTDGQLREQAGDMFKPRREYKRPDGPKRWKSIYWAARSKKWNATFREAFYLFAKKNYWSWPSRSWPLMPLDELDTFRKVSDVPYERLIQEGVTA